MKKTPIAVVGVGAFGKQHARVLSALPQAELVAVVDQDANRAGTVAQEFHCRALSDPTELVGQVEAAVVAVPTVAHEQVGCALLEAGIDVLVEKPIAPDLAAADALIAAAERNQRILQAGHLERFNPVVEAAHELASLPLFFEVHRMSTFSPRSLDVDVVLDLMIHDLDIVLSMVDSPVERLEATGLPILSERADIASVRLVFENGCVANLTASRISVEKIRKLRFFQPRQYISIDYTRQDGAVFEVDASNKIKFGPLQAAKGEPLARQAEDFLRAVTDRTPPRVGGEDARAALALGLRIIEEMARHARIVAATVASQGP
jgi:predicted dehydrogenase